LSTLSSWRIVERGALAFGSEDPDAAVRIEALIGRAVVAFRPVSARVTSDAALEFENGNTLEVFAATVSEPWVLHLPRPPVLVPSPSNPKWGELPNTG